MFELNPLPIPGAFVIQGKILRDERGFFHKTVQAEFFKTHGLEWSFAEQFYSISQKDVIRGMHFQKPPYEHVKLIYCTYGSAVDVLLDIRRDSPAYGKCAHLDLKAEDGKTIYIPKGVAHGFRSLQDNTTIQYSVSVSHQPSADEGILWNSIPHDWGVFNPVLSNRDRSFPRLQDFKSPF